MKRALLVWRGLRRVHQDTHTIPADLTARMDRRLDVEGPQDISLALHAPSSEVAQWERNGAMPCGTTLDPVHLS